VNEERILKLKRSAERFTAFRERSPKEVADKLAEWDAKPEEIERIIAELKEQRFIDEHRFARAFCHDKFLVNRWGKRRIAMEISRHQLSREALTEGMNYINAEEYERTLQHLAEQKWLKVKDSDTLKRKQKTVAFLLQKGFESDLIWEVVNELTD
jgi:regulatory protein